MAIYQEANSLKLTQQGTAQRRQDQFENSSRPADQVLTYTTAGVGELVVVDQIVFDTQFLGEPSFTSGSVVAQSPDLELYGLPRITIGVYKWVKHPQQQQPTTPAVTLNPSVLNGPDDLVPTFYTGCYIFFVVECPTLAQPVPDLRTTIGLQQDKVNLQTTVVAGYAVTDPNYLPAVQSLQADREQLARDLAAAAPPRPIIHHHLRFFGVAQKELSGIATSLQSNPAIPPASTPQGNPV